MNEPVGVSQTNQEALAALVTDEERAHAYLETILLLQVATELQRARERAGLTQAALAQRLGTQQSVISRTERDADAGLSVRRFVRWALACHSVPRGLELVPVDSLVELAQACIQGRELSQALDSLYGGGLAAGATSTAYSANAMTPALPYAGVGGGEAGSALRPFQPGPAVQPEVGWPGTRPPVAA